MGSAFFASRHFYCFSDINLLMFASPFIYMNTHKRNNFKWQISVSSIFLSILTTNEIFQLHAKDSKNSCFHFSVNYYSLNYNIQL